MKTRSLFVFLLVLVLTALTVSGCGRGRGDIDIAIAVALTQTAAAMQQSPTPGETAVPLTLPPPTVALPTPTNTSLPPTPPTFTPSPTPCLPDARFVESVTIPDKTNLLPGQKFTKVWRIKSTGCAPWPAGTRWVFVSGDLMGASSSIALPAIPSVGDTVDISVDMQAPSRPGSYKGSWRLQDPDGTFFTTEEAIPYVLIIVPSAAPVSATPVPPTPAPLRVNIIYYKADKYHLDKGGCAVVEWKVENAQQVLYGFEGHMGGAAPEEKRWECLDRTTTFRLEVQNLDGTWETPRELVINVGVSEPSTSIFFTADKTTIVKGESVKLSWWVEGVKAIYYQDEAVEGPGGSRIEQPSITTTYTLRVVHYNDESETRSVTVVVLSN